MRGKKKDIFDVHYWTLRARYVVASPSHILGILHGQTARAYHYYYTRQYCNTAARTVMNGKYAARHDQTTPCRTLYIILLLPDRNNIYDPRKCACAGSVFSIPAPAGGRWGRTGNIVMLLKVYIIWYVCDERVTRLRKGSVNKVTRSRTSDRSAAVYFSEGPKFFIVSRGPRHPNMPYFSPSDSGLAGRTSSHYHIYIAKTFKFDFDTRSRRLNTAPRG